MLSLLWHEFTSRRSDILGWSFGLGSLALVYFGIYPSMADQMAGFDLSEVTFYEAMGVTDMATFEGFASSTVVNIMPIILCIYAIITGTAALAGQEDDGTLELIAALPLSRWKIVFAKGAGIGLALLAIVLLTNVAVMLLFNWIEPEINTSIATTDWIPIILTIWPLTMAFAMASLLFSAIAPTRGVAGLLATLFFLVNYIGRAVTNMTSSLEHWRPAILFHYHDSTRTIFTDGVDPRNVAVLLAVAAAFWAASALFFQRRDLMVGRWSFG